MEIPYYDNLEATLIDDVTCLVEVERIYVFDWGRFEEAHWRRLARIYEELPGAVRLRDVPWWFGDDEDVPPFLAASVEPAGLQVRGILPEADWLAWDERFRRAVGELLPWRALESPP
jgi:hypothetical protein